MQQETVDWRGWSAFFERRANRGVPQAQTDSTHSELPASLSRSLAIFQLGESGGGTIVGQAARSSIKAIDGHYANAIRLFVKEENRHADILAVCIGMLGGSLIEDNWTARLFVRSRRLLGLRLKVLVLLAAEVVGLCYYHLLAAKLPPCQVRTLLQQMVSDEKQHLQFHCCFLRSQTGSLWKRAVFVLAWRITMSVAAVAVLFDHRHAIRDLDLRPGIVWRRWMLYCRLAERLVTCADDEMHQNPSGTAACRAASRHQSAGWRRRAL
jgi:hypothetical protein